MNEPVTIKKETYVVLLSRVPREQKSELEQIAKRKNQKVAFIVRELLALGMKSYYGQDGSVVCQLCNNSFPNDNRHQVLLEDKEYVIGDCCYFNENVKDLFKKSYFHCQSCGSKTPIRRRHQFPIGPEVLSFGDCCYFNNSYKKIVIQMIQ